MVSYELRGKSQSGNDMRSSIISRPRSNSMLGGKAKGLELLSKNGISVPKFIALSFDEVEMIITSNETLKLFCSELKTYFGDVKIAIRSSANKEDGDAKSYAGFFSSVLNVTIKDDEILNALKTVKQSAYRANANEDIKMNIVLQEMISPLVSGVCFTETYNEKGEKFCKISCVDGLADKLVDGRAKASSLIIPIEDERLNVSHIKYIGNVSFLNIGFVSLVKQIQDVMDRIYKDADLEWCIDKDGNAWFVQLRKITSKVSIHEEVSSCTVTSEGMALGRAKIIDSSLPTDELMYAIKTFPKNCILVSEYTDTMFMPAIKKAIAIITCSGDLLSHSAIVARELNIPCIALDEKLFSQIKDGVEIQIDTRNNILIIDNKKNLMQEKGNSFAQEINWETVNNFDNIAKIKIGDEIFLIEMTPNNLILYHSQRCNKDTIDEVLSKLFSKFNQEILLSSNTIKYHWYFEWENFSKLELFQKYKEKMKEAILSFDGEKITHLYDEISVISKDLKRKEQLETNVSKKLFIQENIVSLYFLLDMYVPQGLSISMVYKECLGELICSNTSFLDLVNPYSIIGDEKLLKAKEFLKIITEEKNKIFKSWISNGILIYDFMSLRDRQIRSLFDNRYEKYDEVMYNEYYKKYILTSFEDNIS